MDIIHVKYEDGRVTLRWEVDKPGSDICTVVNFLISCVKNSGSAKTVSLRLIITIQQ